MIFNGEVGTVAAKRGIVKAEKTGLLSMGQITHQHHHQGSSRFRHSSCVYLLVTIVCFYLSDKPNIICLYPGEVCAVQDGLRGAAYSGDYGVSSLAHPGRRPGRAGPLELRCLP